MEALSAIGPIGTVSEKYVFVNSSMLLKILNSYGYHLTDYKQQGNTGFAKHLMRLRKANAFGLRDHSEYHEIVIINSHDATSALQIHAGIFRSICMNGLIVGDQTVPPIKVRHVKGSDFLADFEASFETYLNSLSDIESSVATLKSIAATTEIQDLFRSKVSEKLKRDFDFGLTIRKRIDDKPDLWTVYNNTQERILRGTARYTKNGVLKHQKPITSIDKMVKVNKILWDTALEVAREC